MTCTEIRRKNRADCINEISADSALYGSRKSFAGNQYQRIRRLRVRVRAAR